MIDVHLPETKADQTNTPSHHIILYAWKPKTQLPSSHLYGANTWFETRAKPKNMLKLVCTQDGMHHK